jgi:death on curing protein
MKEPQWIEKEALLLLHSMSLARFGGPEGIRDEGLLESALARPKSLFHYGQASDLADIAASNAFGIVKNHAFVDGNKRAGFLACGLFLELNGKALVATAADAIAAVTALADGTIGEGEFAAWIRANWK